MKEGKYLRTTPLGEVVNGLMCEKFQDIVDTSFTANMEKELDEVEDGHIAWKDCSGSFTAPSTRTWRRPNTTWRASG